MAADTANPPSPQQPSGNARTYDDEPWRLVGRTIAKHVAVLQTGYLADRADAVAALAQFRRGAGHRYSELPELWGLFPMDAVYDGVRSGAEVERAENAVHLAVTLWARHQQSRRAQGMHRNGGPELGAAVRLLMPGKEIDEPVRRRFVRAGSATSFEILAQRLSELVLLFRRDEITMDYGLLATQLHIWQRPCGEDRVRRSWERSFHVRPKAADASAGPGPDPTK